ncbi:hypothetical protein B4113_0645 [Geobacillus sp. B4113_201601]|nr:hypothetical protein B4113_0645 [Geobacillus sp. B4113_201601]
MKYNIIKEREGLYMQNTNMKRWWILGSLSLGLIAVGLDITILNVALPTLATELHASTSDLQWFVDSYNLAMAAFLLPAGMLGDRFGRKRLLLFALCLFGLASIGCAYSNSPEILIWMRTFLGLGAAFLIPLSISILPVLFSERERTKAMMIWATANMLGIPLGPIVGGWLLEHYQWGSVFLLNLPFVVVALAAVSWLMPESRSPHHSKLDWLGVLTSSAGLVSITYGAIKAGEKGWSHNEVILFLAIGCFMLSVFAILEKKVKHPLVDLSLFRSRSFTFGAILATLATYALFGLLFTLPQYFQSVEGNDTLETGLRLLPLIGGLIVGAKSADFLLEKIGPKSNAFIGFVFLAIGLGIGGTTQIDHPYKFIALWITIVGIGLGLALPTAMDAALGELSAERSGVGSALIMALRQAGGSIGVAVLGTIVNSQYRSRIEAIQLPSQLKPIVKQSVSTGVEAAHQIQSMQLLSSVRKAFVHGMEAMLWTCCGIAILGAILSFAFLPNQFSSKSKQRMSVH